MASLLDRWISQISRHFLKLGTWRDQNSRMRKRMPFKFLLCTWPRARAVAARRGFSAVTACSRFHYLFMYVTCNGHENSMFDYIHHLLLNQFFIHVFHLFVSKTNRHSSGMLTLKHAKRKISLAILTVPENNNNNENCVKKFLVQ